MSEVVIALSSLCNVVDGFHSNN